VWNKKYSRRKLKTRFSNIEGMEDRVTFTFLGTPSGNVNFVHWDLLSKIRIKMKK